ncbi:MAG TPA: ribose-5-phosphate isomerase RpiA [Thermomicrobiaceae bacterium]|nr:ribose-5-phosphate isomerase RpiA [Thermomicrobiaceae bacterium]
MPEEPQEKRVQREKRAAAERAAAAVEDGMVVGLGSGTTAELAVRALGERVRAGLRIQGVASSDRTAALARALGIPLLPLERPGQIDLTIDGADEIVPGTLSLLKGHGGALVREKLVAIAARRVLIVADHTKLVDRLGERHAVPVEVVPFGARLVAAELTALGGTPVPRLAALQPFITDNGNLLLDVAFGPIADPAALAARLKQISGVVDHGLFIGLAGEALIGTPQGITILHAD